MRLPESAAFHAYIAPARASSAWWRVLLGGMVIVVCWLGLGIVLMTAVVSGWLIPLGVPPYIMTLTGKSFMSPMGIILFLLTFLFMWLGVWLALRLVHRRRLRTVFSATGRIDGRAFWMGVLLGLVYLAVSIAVHILFLGPPERTALPLDVWTEWMVSIALFVVIQASAEEVMFRGYILQYLASWSRHPLVWAVLPSVAFALLHYDSALDPAINRHTLTYTVSFGLVASVLVWRTGGLAAAMGLHIVNNILAIGMFGLEGTALGLELWLFPPEAPDRMMLFNMVLGVVMLAAAFILFKPERAR